MSKGLQALEEIKTCRLIKRMKYKEGLFSNKLIDYEMTYGKDAFYRQIPIIEQELKEGEKDHELKVEICEYFGLDDLFPYNDNSKIMEKLKETQSHYYDIQFKKSKKEKALEIIKRFVWIENGEIHLGLYGDSEIVLKENDFESKEEYDLLKKIRGLKSWKYLCENGHVDIPTPKRK